MSKMLSGPHGSVKHDILTKEGATLEERQALTHPAALLSDPVAFELSLGIVQRYAQNGADVLTPDTFGARHILKAADPQLYRDVIRGHLLIPQRVAEQAKVVRHEVAVTFGPFGDCYKPNEGPKSVAEGVEFWETALEPLIDAEGQIDFAIAETVNNLTEAIAFALAWRNIKKHLGDRIQGVLSMIPMQQGVELLSGERVTDVIRAIAAEVGSFPVLLGLNCCSIDALEPTLRSVVDDTSLGNIGAQFRFIYPNASKLNPLVLDQSAENQVSQDAETAGSQLADLVERYEKSLPGLVHVVLNECCGGTPERTKIIKSRLAKEGNVA